MSNLTILRTFNMFKKSTRNFSNVGFLGIGNMGNHMAKNLLKKGHKLTVFDVNPSAMLEVIKMGAKKAESVAETARDSDVIITMLPTNQHILDCYTGQNGILSSVKENTLLIDSSTIDPSISRRVAERAKENGAQFIDGPVSGGVVGAEDATLTFMVGGTKENYEKAKPLLEAMGSRIVHCGDVGLGQVAKICNNMLLGITMIGVSEAFNLGEKLGLDVKILSDIVNTSTGKCWSSEKYSPVPGILPGVPSSKNYEGGFQIKLIAKDLGLAQAAATDVGFPIMLGSMAHQIYRTAISQGFSDKDFAVVYQFMKGRISAESTSNSNISKLK